jgi:polysaccharide biosynthesis protein PslG
MQRLTLALTFVVVLLLGLILVPTAVNAQDGPEEEDQIVYVVRSGDNLYNIALQFGVSVDAIVAANNIQNPSIIVEGQRLIIPAPGQATATTPPPTTPTAEPTETETETPTPEPTEEPVETAMPDDEGVIFHVVQEGENLFRIAELYGTTVLAIVVENNITDPNVITVGQRLRIPTEGVTPTPTAETEDPTEEATETPTEAPVATEEPTEQPTETVTPEPTAEPTEEATEAPTEEPVETETVTPEPTEEPTEAPTEQPAETETATPEPVFSTVEYGFGFGIEVTIPGLDATTVAGRVEQAGVNWAKHQIDWGRYEPIEGQIQFDEIDFIVANLEETGANILLSVVGSPDWARPGVDGLAPPADYQDYANFVGALASRYGTRVAAYEIWDQPNVQSNWNGKAVSGQEYVTLLTAAYDAIKAAQPEVAVISAGLAPTGGAAGIAINDRDFLQAMYAAGLADVSDGVGAHPYGWANPPDSTCCENNPDITEFDDHPSFFFLETLQDYRAIMLDAGDGETFIWVTEFGWGSNENFPIDAPPGFSYIEDVSLDEQSQYLERSFTLADSLEYVGPMFAWNMNACQVVALDSFECFWSMLDPAGNPRPVFNALAGITQ